MGIKCMAKNRDVFLVDPTTYTIPNNGVAKVIDPRTPEEWSVLRYELEKFVCEGGLVSAAGTLGAGAGKSVRLALLGIMFRSSGLPEQYAPARFVLWLMQNGYYKDVKAGVERNGRDFTKELNNMYVSPVLAQSLLEIYPGFTTSAAEARNLLRAQYPNKEDISDDELLRTMEDVLELQ